MEKKQSIEYELISQLASEKRSVQIQAIVRLSRTGTTYDALKAVLPFANSNDRELSFFATQAVNRIAKKTGFDLASLDTSVSQQESTPEYRPLDFLEPDNNKIPTLLTYIRENHEKMPADLLPSVAVFIGKHGDIGDSEFLFSHLQNDNSNLLIPFIAAAEKVAPDVLPKALPRLLASTAPLIRSRAVRALMKIDSTEAERHFSDLLGSSNPENRLAAIGISFIFPFARVSKYILSILPEEKDLDVLAGCSALLSSNPDLDIALGILDGMDSTEPAQKEHLKIMFISVCDALVKSGLLDQEKGQPEEIIQLWKKERLKSFLTNLELELPYANDNRKALIHSWIDKNKDVPEVKKFIRRLGKNPHTQDTYRILTADILPRTLEKEEKPLSKAAEQVATPQELDKEIQDKLQIMSEIQLDTFPKYKTWLFDLATDGEPELRIKALQTLLRVFPNRRLKDVARKALESENIKIRIEALKILEAIDKSFLIKSLEEFIEDKDEQFRIRIVTFALRHEEAYALKTLQSLINSEDDRKRSNALSCLALFPFEKVKGFLLSQLNTENNPVVAKHIITILLNNASQEILQELDALVRTTNPAVEIVISQARNDMFELLMKKEELESQQQTETPVVISETEQPQSTKTSSPSAVVKPYSLSNVRNISKDIIRTSQPRSKPKTYAGKAKALEKKEEKKKTNTKTFVLPLLLFLLLAVLLWYFTPEQQKTEVITLSQKDYRFENNTELSDSKVSTEFRMNRPCELLVKLVDIMSPESIEVFYEDKKIIVNFNGPKAKNLMMGVNLYITLTPYRIDSKGTVFAVGHGLELSKE